MNTNTDSRSFCLVLESVKPSVLLKSEDCKTYKSKGPMQSAKKIFGQIARVSNMEYPKHVFTIVETTTGNTFDYIGTQMNLDEPFYTDNVIKYKRTIKLLEKM